MRKAGLRLAARTTAEVRAAWVGRGGGGGAAEDAPVVVVVLVPCALAAAAAEEEVGRATAAAKAATRLNVNNTGTGHACKLAS